MPTDPKAPLALRYVDDWCGWLGAAAGLEPATVDRYRGLVSRVGAELQIGDPVQLSIDLLERHLEGLRRAGVAKATCAQIVTALKSFCSYLVARGVLERNPVLQIRRPAEYLTPAELAEELKVHQVTVHRWLRSGDLRGLRAGRGWRIQREDLEAFLRGKGGAG